MGSAALIQVKYFEDDDGEVPSARKPSRRREVDSDFTGVEESSSSSGDLGFDVEVGNVLQTHN